MNQLQVIVHDNRRVLTTSQLAESYGTDSKQISYNFNYNKNRYTEGKHFIALEGEEKRNFINRHEIQDGSKNAKTLYLWTEKGAWLHAKSLNTDEAWDAYEMLVDEYYNVVEQQKANFTMPGAEDHITLALEAALETRKQVQTIQSEVKEVKAGIEELRDNLYITGLQAKTLRLKANQKVYEALGGKDSNAFKHLKNRTYSACWREFWDYFGISEYRELPRVKYEEGLRFLIAWQPKTELRLEIEHYNTQLVLKLIK